MTGLENLPQLQNVSTEELTQTLYAKIPKWILAAMAAMGQESKAIEELTDLTAEAFKQGYSMGVNDTMNSITAQSQSGESQQMTDEYRPTPTNVRGLLEYVKKVRASTYKQYPFINGASTKKEAIAKLQALLDKGVKVI